MREPLAEYLRHRLVDSPLEPVVAQARRARAWLQVLRDPGLSNVYVQEPAAIEAVLTRLVRDGMHCVDVGAHIGSMTAALRRLSPSGRHIAVEPTPYKAKWLRARYPDVEIVECALSTQPGRASFYYHERASGFSGLRASTQQAAPPISFDVELRRLDDVVPGDRRVGFVKVDVEGGELDVFAGAHRILSRDRPTVLFECTLSGLEMFGQTAADMHRLFAGYGYEIFTPIDLLHDRAPLDESAFDRALRFPFHAFNFVALPLPGGDGAPTRGA